MVILSGLGLLFGFGLSILAKKFAVKEDPRVEEINSILPQANCGACNYPGCLQYSLAVVAGKAPPDSCIPGGTSVADKLSRILGIEVTAKEKKVAVLLCQGSLNSAYFKYRYRGPEDCRMAVILSEGDKSCPSGCLGLGTCVRACPFDAMWINPETNLVEIDNVLCTGCGKCVDVCPKNVLELIPVYASVIVRCKNIQNPKLSKAVCEVSCFACKICERACTVEDPVIKVNNNLAKIDYSRCTACGQCAEVCPTNCIYDISTKLSKIPLSS